MLSKPKKKVDYEALNSSFMHIPRMDTQTARDLINLGLQEIYELSGRCPNALFERIKKNKNEVPQDRLYAIRMAVYFAENTEPDPAYLHPQAWRD